MTMKEFNFGSTNEAKVYGAMIESRVDDGRAAIEPTARRATNPQPTAAA
jgi:hypothetical protein